jgi:DNA-binding winged helix-turn-helix (wHTH) protein/tetratricopeptide (TPR) repeat protein
MNNRFRFGDWLVDPVANSIEGATGKRQLEPRMMEVLVALCGARGEIVSGDDLLEHCWGSALMGDGPLHKTVAQLRRALGDSASAPVYLETIRMRGYRTVAPLDFNVGIGNGRRSWQAGSPFRGLLAFGPEHADVFFGRDDVTRKLVETAAAQVRSGLAAVVVLGPSGSGKTSVVQAGLLPALLVQRARSDPSLLACTTFDLFDLGGQSLFTALAGSLLDLQWDERWAFSGENAVSLGARLEHHCETVVAELPAMLAPHAQAGRDVRFGIFIDRFEALFNTSRITDAERDAFLAMLGQLARSGSMLLVVACRNDFYPSIARYPLLIECKRNGGHFDLEPPGFGDIAQMIRRPAAAAKLTFGIAPVTGAGLDDILCASAAGQPDALPLLQYCLQELYRLRTEEGELSFEAFHRLGELEGAIGQRAEQVVLGLSDAQQAGLPHIMSLIIVLSDDGVNVSSQRAPWASLHDDARQAVIALVESRLFVSDLVGDIPVFGIAHDAILRRWPRMTEWVAAHRGAIAARGRLAQHASRWCGEGRPADLLLPRGKLLGEARELDESGIWSLAPHERELIQASERRIRQRERVRVLALTLIVALAVLASGLGMRAVLAERAAEQRRREAEGLMDFMLGDFSDKLRPLGRLDLLESVSGKALQYLSGANSGDLGPAALTLRAKGLQTIGEVSRSRGDPKQALDALGQARAILLRQRTLTPRDPAVLKNLGANAYWVAQIHKDQNDWQAAEVALRDYLKFADQLYELDPANPEWWVEQSYAHNNLGALAQTCGKPAAAAPEFAASIALKQRALARWPDASAVVVELADSYSWLAAAQESLGQLPAAERLYEQEMGQVRKLRDRFPGESMWIYREVRALQHRAGIALALGRDADASRDYQNAKSLFTPLVDGDKANRAWQVELASLEQERLRVMERSTNPGALLPSLVEAHRNAASIHAMDPKNAWWTRRDAIARARMGAALVESGQAPAGRREIGIAVDTLRGLYADNPSDLNGRLVLVDTLLLSASVSNCRQAYEIIGKQDLPTLNYKILDAWVRINMCLGNKAIADAAIKRLHDIGYRDTSFIRFTSTH